MNLWFACIKSMASVFSFSAAPLYRYPYRNGAEAFRSDWKLPMMIAG